MMGTGRHTCDFPTYLYIGVWRLYRGVTVSEGRKTDTYKPLHPIFKCLLVGCNDEQSYKVNTISIYDYGIKLSKHGKVKVE